MASLFNDMMDEAGEQAAEISRLQAEVRRLQTDLSWERNENARLRTAAGEAPRAEPPAASDAGPVVVPMGPGERPSKEGWYAVRDPVDGMVLLTEVMGIHLRLRGDEENERMDYVARIHPDRIPIHPETAAKVYRRRR